MIYFAACLATLQEITESNIIAETHQKEQLIRKLLKHSLIKEIRGKGLMLALLFDSAKTASEVILRCKDNNLILFWLLFEPRAIRITPPLTITEMELKEGCAILTDVLDNLALTKLS